MSRAGVLQGLAFAAAIGAVAYGAFAKPSPSKMAAPNAAVFDRVWTLVSQNYYDQAIDGVDWNASRERFRPIALGADDTVELYEEAIWPMLDQISASHVDAARPGSGSTALADKVGHFSGRRGEALSMSSDGIGDLGGLDAVYDGKQWLVYDVRKDSEAAGAGLSPGSVITALAVDPVREGRYRASMRLTDAGGGTTRASYEFAPRIRAASRSMEMRPSGVAVLRFDVFDAETVDWALGQLRQAEPAPLLLDLRENRGGDIDQMLRFVSAFLPGNVLVGNSKGRRWPHTFPLNAKTDTMEYRGPVAVLMGPKTGSAGEVTSYTLGKHRGAPLVGERTAGAVLAARRFGLPDGGELMIATGNFTTADDQRLEGVGVVPSIPAAPTLAAIREGRDLVVEAGERAVLALSAAPAP